MSQMVPQVELDWIEAQLTYLNLGKVQNLIDQGQELDSKAVNEFRMTRGSMARRVFLMASDGNGCRTLTQAL